jgi:hypothetical protein
VEKLLLQELVLSNTRLKGSLDCALVKPKRKVRAGRRLWGTNAS